MAPKSRKPQTQLPSHLKPGSQVEISSDDPGFRGSLFAGTVIRRSSAKNPTKFLVEYETLFSDEAGKKRLREILDMSQLRPVPLKERKKNFNAGDEVDAYYNDGWWEGEVLEDLGDGRFSVYFRTSKEQIEFGKEDLRLHREWINGDWKPPFEEENEVNPEEGKEKFPTEIDVVSKNGMVRVEFGCGTLVEVSSDEEGFQGSWFSARIIESRGKGKYLVEYQNLKTEDNKEFLREEIDVLHIRPQPPEQVLIGRFSKFNEVDAWYNDGWWVGMISKVLSDSKYIVYFMSSEEEIKFDHSKLRLHQEWINGKWVVASQSQTL